MTRPQETTRPPRNQEGLLTLVRIQLLGISGLGVSAMHLDGTKSFGPSPTEKTIRRKKDTCRNAEPITAKVEVVHNALNLDIAYLSLSVMSGVGLIGLDIITNVGSIDITRTSNKGTSGAE